MASEQSPIPVEQIERAILLIRGQKVMLDADLAKLYGVETKALNRAVKRNRERFPEDFMLQLTVQEVSALRCQFGTSNIGRGGRRYSPYVFTEQGVAMLSTVLNSARAIQVNIAIMRAFVKLREMLSAHTELRQKLAELERTLEGHDGQIRSLFDAIRQLMAPPRPQKPPRTRSDRSSGEDRTFHPSCQGAESSFSGGFGRTVWRGDLAAS